ncbi:hypothetical protein D3C79_781300 [compost metagenome]
MISFDIAGIALVLAVHANVLTIGGIARGVFVQTGNAELEVVDFFGGEHRPLKHRGQQAAVVVLEQWHIRQQRAVLEYGLRIAHFSGQAHFRVLVD